MPDMLVNLYQLPESMDFLQDLPEGVKIKRAMAPDTGRIMAWIEETFSVGWAHECQKALFNSPQSCFLAVKDKEIVGFACYDATALGYFGPLGVAPDRRKGGIGRALTLRCLHAMREKGYGYAIIGWVGPAAFYEKICGARIIEDSLAPQTAYRNMIKVE